ncbi:hypothetical protein ADL22_26820 [Streptomyces sp. NRRL F-4489]|uniref:hypothetical protein n=1 Tax=Streptomyces sp. NRRL F-4489 TaxID=1609095 RepID=UPI0007491695|nr:hypothetical protein [Streptomyces sp. NRRL F-4489]KUL35578.1 hypothetical protein ADL22_26820 [Streptomyces sp. NRRL F-4489]
MTVDIVAPTAQWGAEHSADLACLAARYAVRFPWYGHLLARRGVLGSDRLDELPVLGPDLLTAHYYTAEHPQFPCAGVYFSSGTSTGRPKRVLYSPADEDAYATQRRELFEAFLAGLPLGGVAVTDLGACHAAASARRIFLEMGFDAHDIESDRPLGARVRLLNDHRPDVLFTTPAILDQLLRSPDPLRIAPRKVIVAGGLAPAGWRRRVAERFGIGFADVLDVFDSVEIGAIAHYDAAAGHYRFHDHILPEVVPPGADGAAPGGGSGALLLTSFARDCFPALRYATGDLISGLRRVRHGGRVGYVFDRINGRAARPRTALRELPGMRVR